MQGRETLHAFNLGFFPLQWEKKHKLQSWAIKSSGIDIDHTIIILVRSIINDRWSSWSSFVRVGRRSLYHEELSVGIGILPKRKKNECHWNELFQWQSPNSLKTHNWKWLVRSCIRHRKTATIVPCDGQLLLERIVRFMIEQSCIISHSLIQLESFNSLPSLQWFSMSLEIFTWQRLGEVISDLILRCNSLNCNHFCSNIFSEKVILNIDVLCSWSHFWNIR